MQGISQLTLCHNPWHSSLIHLLICNALHASPSWRLQLNPHYISLHSRFAVITVCSNRHLSCVCEMSSTWALSYKHSQRCTATHEHGTDKEVLSVLVIHSLKCGMCMQAGLDICVCPALQNCFLVIMLLLFYRTRHAQRLCYCKTVHQLFSCAQTWRWCTVACYAR